MQIEVTSEGRRGEAENVQFTFIALWPCQSEWQNLDE
jgi:hypothetical protein